MITPKIVVFDWDETLVENWDLLHQTLNKTLLSLGKPPLSLEETKIRARNSMRNYVNDLGVDVTKFRDKFYENYLSMNLTSLILLPNALDTLNYLKANNVRMAIVSNKRGDILRNEVKQLGLEKYFKKIIGAQDCKEDKPSALPLLEAIDDLSEDDKKTAWMVGDSMTDIQCALNAKCVPIAFSERHDDHIHVTNHFELIKLYKSTLKLV